MTEEERQNRNPAVETERTTWEAIRARPEVLPDDLQYGQVYTLHSDTGRNIVTLNYIGKVPAIDATSLDVVMLRHFYGPRASVHVHLKTQADGTYRDAAGGRVYVRTHPGE